MLIDNGRGRNILICDECESNLIDLSPSPVEARRCAATFHGWRTDPDRCAKCAGSVLVGGAQGGFRWSAVPGWQDRTNSEFNPGRHWRRRTSASERRREEA